MQYCDAIVHLGHFYVYENSINIKYRHKKKDVLMATSSNKQTQPASHSLHSKKRLAEDGSVANPFLQCKGHAHQSHTTFFSQESWNRGLPFGCLYSYCRQCANSVSELVN
jgi:hypothetical protein